MPNPLGYPEFVWLLRRSCPSEGKPALQRTEQPRRCDSDQTYDDAQVSQPHTLLINTCTSCHVYRGDKCHAHPKQALSTAWQQGRGVLEPLYTTTSASSSWSRPRNICSACLSRWHLPRGSPPFIWLGPQPTQKCWQQWPTDELTPSRKCLLPPAWWRQTTTWLAFDSRMLKLKMKSRRGRAWRRRGARVSTVDCARSPYGESTFKRNRPSFAVLMVLGGGGGLASRSKLFNWKLTSELMSIERCWTCSTRTIEGEQRVISLECKFCFKKTFSILWGVFFFLQPRLHR